MAAKPVQNFGGKNNELWCEGGEEAFVRKMVEESVGKANNCLWFTSLISKNTTLPAIYHALNVAGAAEVRTIEMAQGQRSAASSPGPSTTPSNRPPWQPNAGANPSGAGYPDGADKIRILPFNFHHLRYSQYGFNNKNLRLLVYLNSNNYFTE